jgi:hypothetical protein
MSDEEFELQWLSKIRQAIPGYEAPPAPAEEAPVVEEAAPAAEEVAAEAVVDPFPPLVQCDIDTFSDHMAQAVAAGKVLDASAHLYAESVSVRRYP